MMTGLLILNLSKAPCGKRPEEGKGGQADTRRAARQKAGECRYGQRGSRAFRTRVPEGPWRSSRPAPSAYLGDLMSHWPSLPLLLSQFRTLTRRQHSRCVYLTGRLEPTSCSRLTILCTNPATGRPLFLGDKTDLAATRYKPESKACLGASNTMKTWSDSCGWVWLSTREIAGFPSRDLKISIKAGNEEGWPHQAPGMSFRPKHINQPRTLWWACTHDILQSVLWSFLPLRK